MKTPAFERPKPTPSAPTAKKFTAEDYKATPEGPPWIQLIDGEFIVSESPTPYHQFAVGNLYVALSTWADRNRAGIVCLAPLDVYLSKYDVVQPDLFFISAERRASILKDRVYGAPDLVVEVLSPSTAPLDKVRKRALYARVGVREMWLVDTDLKQVQIHHFAGNSCAAAHALGVGDKLSSPVLPGFSTEVAAIFRR